MVSSIIPKIEVKIKAIGKIAEKEKQGTNLNGTYPELCLQN